MAHSNQTLSVPASSLDSPSRSSFNSAGPDAATSERNLSDGSLHYYSTEDDDTDLAMESKLIPIRQVVSSLQDYQEDLGTGSDDTTIFPSRLGGPDEMPVDSVNAHFPRSGPHRWFGRSDIEKMHPLHGHVFSLYYGPHFRKPAQGWTGNERSDWLRYLWDWRPPTEHAETTFDAWVQTPRAEELWMRRLRDKACEYYVEYCTVQGTVLEQREVVPKEQREGPTNEFEPDIYCLRNYLTRIELGRAFEEARAETEEEEGGDGGDNDVKCNDDARSARSDVSSEPTSSISSSLIEKRRARRLERQFKGIKAPPSSIREPTPDAPSIRERRHSRLQFLKSALMAVWTSAMSADDEAPAASGSVLVSGTVTPRPPTADSDPQADSRSSPRSMGRGGETPGLINVGRRRSRASTATLSRSFQ